MLKKFKKILIFSSLKKKILKKIRKIFSNFAKKKCFFFEILGSKNFFQFLKNFFEKILSWRWKFRMLCFFSYIKHGSKLSEGYLLVIYGKSGLHRRLCKNPSPLVQKKSRRIFFKNFFGPFKQFSQKNVKVIKDVKHFKFWFST